MSEVVHEGDDGPADADDASPAHGTEEARGALGDRADPRGTERARAMVQPARRAAMPRVVRRVGGAAGAAPSVVILVADGVRPDTLSAALDEAALPALARLRAEGGLHAVTSVFPSVTGPAYAPFVMGRFPGPVGLPGLRWYDRARGRRTFPDRTRSYVGAEMRHVDGDLDAAAPTLFELAARGGVEVAGRRSVAALNVIGRGLGRGDVVGRGAGFILRAARTHFRGDVRGWLDIDRDVGAEVARLVRERRPAVTFAALTGVDKTSHSAGHAAPVVREALRIVDRTVERLRADAERDGAWEGMRLWVVSDHGHSPVAAHDDLAALLRGWGHRTLAHPWVWSLRRPDVAVMVSGNAMAHLYLEPYHRERPWWPALAGRWEPLVAALLARESVDLMLLPHSPARCEVRGAGARGRAIVECTTGAGAAEGARYSYRPLDGDPLGVGPHEALDAGAAHAATLASDYPDAIVQIAHLAGAARAGDVILSAARGWDFRERYEPIPHVSSHGALHRDHMLVPLLLDRPATRPPRRTADVMPSALEALGLPVPAGLDGESFL
ncbi:MAG: alkaline phosphatase family protein [Gemmatimonadaceae bacterium]